MIDYDDDYEEIDGGIILDNCPNCGEPYDEIDYEYQICHLCNHDAHPDVIDDDDDSTDPNDSRNL